MKIKIILIIFLALFTSTSLFAQTLAEKNTEQYYEFVKQQPKKLAAFLRAFPKGADLHTHLGGASFTENLIQYADKDGFCIDNKSYLVYEDKNCKSENLLTNFVKNPQHYEDVLDAWSMHHFSPQKGSGHDHFFATFAKFSLIAKRHVAEIIAEVAQRTALQNTFYIELMLTPDNNASGKLGAKLGYNSNFSEMRAKLFENGLDKIVTDMSQQLNVAEDKKQALLACKDSPLAGCKVKVRYIYQVYREQEPEMVFAQMLAGFDAANKDKRIVGINMVQPEDGKISMQDYALHMQMIKYLHSVYPSVHVSLHAGELTNGLVSDEGLKFHIRDAVKVANAERIGHGVDILNEDQFDQLLNFMAEKKILVEVNLSSNNYILGIKGSAHPIAQYLKYNVPVALSTDDEGVSREDLTAQYLQAVEGHQFSYQTLKTLARNSISYSFLPGENLWVDGQYHHFNAACKNDLPGRTLSAACHEFLDANEKAKTQWDLEVRFAEFEKRHA